MNKATTNINYMIVVCSLTTESRCRKHIPRATFVESASRRGAKGGREKTRHSHTRLSAGTYSEQTAEGMSQYVLERTDNHCLPNGESGRINSPKNNNRASRA
ncbi:MAG: hypothetical protein LBS84_09990, partial [Clostridiales bacterium]|nr:hypothetical protein [Clostridiales bacterium]